MDKDLNDPALRDVLWQRLGRRNRDRRSQAPTPPRGSRVVNVSFDDQIVDNPAIRRVFNGSSDGHKFENPARHRVFNANSDGQKFENPASHRVFNASSDGEIVEVPPRTFPHIPTH